MKLIGQREKLFKDWGHCGACGNGAFNFVVTVNVWEYVELENLYGEFTTKNYDKFHLSIIENESDRIKHNNYKYLVTTSGCTAHTAFKTDRQYQAWLKTFNGVEFDGHWQNTKVIFTHKQIEKRVSLKEYNNIEGVIDVTLENDNKWNCKRVYKDNQVITYNTL